MTSPLDDADGLELALDAPDDIDFGEPGPPGPEPLLEIDLEDCPF